MGDEFVFKKYLDKDDYLLMGKGSQCAGAWDCISKYIYTALQGGSLMRDFTKNDKILIVCCNEGTRPVIFKIERIDYKAVYIDGIASEKDETAVATALLELDNVISVDFDKEYDFAEVVLEKDVPDEVITETVEKINKYKVSHID